MPNGFVPLNRPEVPKDIQVVHQERGVRYAPMERQILGRRLGKLAIYCKAVRDESSIIRVESERRDTKKSSDAVKVTITVELPREVLRSESRKSNAIEAFDRAVEKMEPQILRYKEMHTGRQKAHRKLRQRGE